MFYVYFIKSLKNKKIYTGMTEKHPNERLKEHNYGLTKWAKENRPFYMIYFEEYFCKTDACKRENFYKNGIGRKIRNAIINVMDNKGA
jgi:predicted GIY-YIG superfamily endonuclease